MENTRGKKSRVTVVIPTRHVGAALDRTLMSILRGTVVPEILVIDCGSGDGTPERVRRNFPQVRVMELGLNPGRAHAVNIGFHLIQTPYVMTLGQNIVVGKHCVERLCRTLEQDDALFSAQAKILSEERTEILLSAGWNMDAIGIPYVRGQGRRAVDYTRKTTILAADLTASVYRMRALEEIGLLDERLYGWLEDVDLGYRAGLAGYRNLYVPQAVVKRSNNTDSAIFREKVKAGNLLYLRYKNLSSVQQIFIRPFVEAYEQRGKRNARKFGMTASYKAAIERGRMLCFNAEMELAEQQNCEMSVTKLCLPEEFAMAVADERLSQVYPLWLGVRAEDGREQIPAHLRMQALLVAGSVERAVDAVMMKGGGIL